MANTITNAAISRGRTIVKYVTLVSDGSEETDYVVYDSSAEAAVSTNDGVRVDPLNCRIMKVEGCLTVLDETAVDISCYLEWDASTDVTAFTIPKNRPFKFCFEEEGGLVNQGGSGKTGDITMTTTGLESGDRLFLVIHVQPN